MGRRVAAQHMRNGGTTNDDSHEYDGDGKRMRSKLAGATEWREFVYDELSGEILMEYTLVGGTFTIKAVNTWGLGLISSNREGVKRYFHFDALGSTRALTDSSGNVTDTYEYNAFGVLESSTGFSTNPFRYVGQWGYYDDGAMGSSSGLLLLGVRYYSPAHGRFWSWDPVPNENLYAYVGNSATMAIDPAGANPLKPIPVPLRRYLNKLVPDASVAICIAVLITEGGWTERSCMTCCQVGFVLGGSAGGGLLGGAVGGPGGAGIGRFGGAVLGGLAGVYGCESLCHCWFHPDDPDCQGGPRKPILNCCCNCGMGTGNAFPCDCARPPSGCYRVGGRCPGHSPLP